jgi:Protein of unknown function (DUF3027)
MTSTPDETVSRALALTALGEITPVASIGEFADSSVNEDGVLTLRFTNRLSGYPNWFWTVSLAQVDEAEPTVLEVELLPGDGSLLAPDWVPWAERLADYQAAQAALAAQGVVIEEIEASDEELDDDDLDDVDDLDASDFDNDGSPILHSGDVDGVDIDELDESADDDEFEEDDESEDEDDDERQSD